MESDWVVALSALVVDSYNVVGLCFSGKGYHHDLQSDAECVSPMYKDAHGISGGLIWPGTVRYAIFTMGSW